MKQQIDMRDKKKLLISAMLFAVVLVAIGYMSLSQSDYKSVADLANVKKRVKVTVEGNVTPIGEGVYRLIIGGKTYIVKAHRSYGVALLTTATRMAYSSLQAETSQYLPSTMLGAISQHIKWDQV